LCAKLGISNSPRQDHAGYIDQFLELLKLNNRVIFTAAGKAQQAVDFLDALQPHEPEGAKEAAV
jgi:antirestriction protein ArdC